MDTRDGTIYTNEQLEKMSKENSIKWNELQNNVIPMEVEPTEKQMSRKPPKVGRNDPCPCGSGIKFKKCCLRLV